MAGHTGLARVVLLRNDLGKPGRPGEIVTVAERAVSSSPGSLRRILIRRLNVSGSRPVADLAGYPPVPGLLFESIHIIVAIQTSFIAGIGHFLRSNFLDCLGAIVPVSSKCLRHQ